MKRLLKKITKREIIQALLFIASTVIIIYFLPRQGKFGYEFQKGKPWMHEDLYAPFNLPIYKTNESIEAEKDSLLKQYKPYYIRNNDIATNELKEFKTHFTEKWQSYLASKYPDINDYQNKNLSPQKDTCLKKTLQHLNHIYKTGIIELTENLNKPPKGQHYEVYVANNKNETYEIKEVYTEKEAYQKIKNLLNKDIDTTLDNDYKSTIRPFINQINFNDFITPNLIYDKKTSLNIKKNLFNDISYTKGMIQANERIISKGEIVSDKNYQELISLQKEYKERIGEKSTWVWVGHIIFVFVSILVLFLFLNNFRHDILQNTLNTSFILSPVVFFIALSSVIIQYSNWNIYIVPYALLPIIIRTFYDSRLALFIHMITILVVGFLAPNGFEFIFLNFTAGIIALYTLTDQYKRGKLFFTSASVFLTYSIVYFAIAIIQEGNPGNIEWSNILWFAINSVLILTSYLLIFIFEKLFGYLSDATLIELSDSNQPLLRKLSEIAPGTFQHSLQVSNLAEEAIHKIGGNALLVRAGALYHDIGKMDNPIYYIENQDNKHNPHDQLEFDESAKIIINHVHKGIEIAKKYNLPENVIKFIRTHHGNSTVQYFYKNYIKKYPEEPINIKEFTYPGPKPLSKETAVVMMADAVEAASRSLKDITEKSLSELVDNIINYQIETKQFDEANITFRDSAEIRKIFKAKLKNIYHGRIDYPE